MSQSIRPHEFRTLSDNDSICAECGQDRHQHDVVTQQNEREAGSQQQNERESVTQQQEESESVTQQQEESEVAKQQEEREVAAEQPAEEQTITTGVMGEMETGRAMKRRNPWLVWLVWPLITLGIYHLVWYYKIHREMAEFQPKRDIPVVGPLLVLIFLGWTIIAPFISYYNTGNRIRSAQRAAGIEVTCSPVLGAVLMFAFGVNAAYFQLELNRVVDRYGVPEGTPVQLYG